MKKTILFAGLLCFSLLGSAQNATPQPIDLGDHSGLLSLLFDSKLFAPIVERFARFRSGTCACSWISTSRLDSYTPKSEKGEEPGGWRSQLTFCSRSDKNPSVF